MRTCNFTFTFAVKCCKETGPELKQVPMKSLDGKGYHRLTFSFYNQPGLELAKALLGKILTRKLQNGTVVRGMIVETEAYLGVVDGACHCYKGKKTPRTKPMFMPPGTSYVYNLYYSQCCFNISCKDEGAVVLIRSLHPVEGTTQMVTYRNSFKRFAMANKKYKLHELCNGPAKLCIAMAIDKNINEMDLCTSPVVWIEDRHHDRTDSMKIIQSCRIGLKSAPDEWKEKPWRFYIYGNQSVSVRDTRRENDV